MPTPHNTCFARKGSKHLDEDMRGGAHLPEQGKEPAAAGHGAKVGIGDVNQL